MKAIPALFLCLCLIGCSKTAKQLEDDGLSSGKKSNSIFGDYYFGMNQNEKEAHSIKLYHAGKLIIIDSSWYADFETSNYIIKAKMSFRFANNYLYRVDFLFDKNSLITKHQTSNSYISEIIDSFSAYHGKYNETGTFPNSKLFWVENNRRIDVVEIDGQTSLIYSDINQERKVNNAYAEDYVKEQTRQANMTIQDKVADDAVKQYGIAQRDGNKMQMCVQAGLCAAAFIQAQDEPNYKVWKHIEDSLSASLGMPTYR